MPDYHFGEIEEGEDQWPGEEDITTEDYQKWYQDHACILETESDPNDWVPKLKTHMEREKFFPNVWHISDHGNADVIVMED
jgi:hypothetical protein